MFNVITPHLQHSTHSIHTPHRILFTAAMLPHQTHHAYCHTKLRGGSLYNSSGPLPNLFVCASILLHLRTMLTVSKHFLTSLLQNIFLA